MASTGLKNEESLHCLYLFALAAAFFRGPTFFEKFSSAGEELASALRSLRPLEIGFSYVDNGRSTEAKTSLGDVIRHYVEMSRQTATVVETRSGSSRYPDSLWTLVAGEFNRKSYNRDTMTSLASYFKLVKFAGQVVK